MINDIEDCKIFNVFQQSCLHRILGVRYWDKVTNEEILQRLEQCRLDLIVREHRMLLAAHILGMPNDHLPKMAMSWIPPRGKRKRGRPHKTWCATFKEDLQLVRVQWEDAESAASCQEDGRRLMPNVQCTNRHNTHTKFWRKSLFFVGKQSSLLHVK